MLLFNELISWSQTSLVQNISLGIANHMQPVIHGTQEYQGPLNESRHVFMLQLAVVMGTAKIVSPANPKKYNPYNMYI